VLPQAEVKIFLTASIEERAERRFLELKAKGFTVDLEALKTEIIQRDKQDSERPIAPLVQARDAILVDTTSLAIAEVVTKLLTICEERAIV
jgi:cytidylate kinase